MSENRNTEQLRAGFEKFFQTTLEPKFADMEAIRKKYLRFFIIGLITMFIVIPAICAALFWIFLQQNNGEFHYHGDLPLGLIFFGLLILIAIVSSPIFFYKRKAKNKVMPEFIKYFGDFQYRFMNYIDNATISKSQLFDEYNTHLGDDYFEGTYQDVGMIISEEKLQLVRQKEKGVSVKNIFEGIIILLEMNKNFSGQTVVLKDKGFLNVFSKIRGLQKVALEDCLFEKEFEVYSNDQLEARYILTTAFMERMLKVREAYKSNKIQFSFFDNQLLIAITSPENMFESTSLFRKTTDRKMIDETFEQFISVMAIIEQLKLNQRTGF